MYSEINDSVIRVYVKPHHFPPLKKLIFTLENNSAEKIREYINDNWLLLLHIRLSLVMF